MLADPHICPDLASYLVQHSDDCMDHHMLYVVCCHVQAATNALAPCAGCSCWLCDHAGWALTCQASALWWFTILIGTRGLTSRCVQCRSSYLLEFK